VCILKKEKKKEGGLLIHVWGGPGSECCGDAFNYEAGGPINNIFLSFYMQKEVSAGEYLLDT